MCGQARTAVNGKKLYSKWIKTREITILNRYNEYDALYRKLCRIRKGQDFKEKYQENYMNTKKLWQITNLMLNRNQKEDNPITAIMKDGKLLEKKEDIANAFNYFFASIGKKISETFPDTQEFMKFMRGWLEQLK